MYVWTYHRELNVFARVQLVFHSLGLYNVHVYNYHIEQSTLVGKLAWIKYSHCFIIVDILYYVTFISSCSNRFIIFAFVLQNMSPPTYSDLGKSARDVFGQGYHFGLFKLDVKTKTQSDVEFSCGGVSNQDTGKVFGNLETKYKLKEYGLTFSEKWNTDNTLATDISIADKLLNGLTLGYSCTFSPQTGWDIPSGLKWALLYFSSKITRLFYQFFVYLQLQNWKTEDDL